jgi:hypothetical protein
MKIKFCIILIFATTLLAHAQSDSTKRVKYFNQFTAGGLMGKSGQGTGVTLSTIHGIRIKRLSVGAGLAFDSYRNWNVVPIFGSISFDVANIKTNSLFLQLNIGYSFANRIDLEGPGLPSYKEYGSQMINPMIGYRINAKKYRLYVQAGHKFQVVHYGYDPQPAWSSFWAPIVSVDEKLSRFVMAIGFGIN